MALLAIMLFSTSCSSDDVVTPDSQEPKEYTVSFNLVGDITDVTQTPLSRAYSGDLYGIQIYSKSKHGGAEYIPYAWGLFDKVDNLKVTLAGGYYYKFVCTYINDGGWKIFGPTEYDSPTDVAYTPYGAPFSKKLTNVFTRSETDEMNGLGKGMSHFLIDDEYWNFAYLDRPESERYYGEVTDYVPSENGSIFIDMKYTVFGCYFKVEGLSEGYISIKLEGAKEMFIEHPYTSESAILTFKDVASAFANTSYSEDILTTIKWVKADDSEVSIASEKLNYARLKRTNVTISLLENTDNNMSITLGGENNSSITNGDSHTLTK